MNHPYRYLFRKTLLVLRGSWSFLWLFFIAAYLMVMAGNAVYRNYQSQQETVRLKNELRSFQQEKERLEALLVYYRTDSFKEKELRRTLLLKKPNEVVYALPESSVAKKVEEELAERSDRGATEVSTLPIWRQWVNYIWFNQEG